MKLGKKLKGIAQLVRLDLSLSAAVCVVAGSIIAFAGVPATKDIIAGFGCGFFISASALILNDYFDIESDKVNAPHRPLPSGAVTKNEIIYLTILTTIVGLYSAFLLSTSVLIVGVIFWSIGFLYNWRLKRTGVLGNIMVASSVGITFVLGAMAVGNPWDVTAWSFALMAFLIDFGEEISADAMDLEGDKVMGSRSIAIIWGRSAALKVSGALFSLVVLVSFLPLVFGDLGYIYLLTMVIIDANIIYFGTRLMRSGVDGEGRSYIKGIYRGIMVGIVILVLGLIII